MNTKLTTLLVALVSVTVALAGCTDGDAPTESTDSEVDPTTVDLGNKGAISGLVVDDNYRPIQLKEEWGTPPGDFQDVGFVLVIETGERFETTTNGEFNVLPLKPGDYTIRVAADNHEAIDKRVKVVAGEFTEVTVEARRTFSQGGTILSQEHTMFSACFANALIISAALASLAAGCGDTSGDSSRFDFWTDYRPIKEDVRGMITEMRANTDGYYDVSIRHFEDGCGSSTLGDCIFAEPAARGERYLKAVVYPGLQWTPSGEYLQEGQDGYCVEKVDTCRNYAFSLEYPFQTALFARHPSEEIVRPITGTQGAGVTWGVKAQFVQNVFLYQLPDDGIEDYCVLCEDADIPE